MPNNDNQMLLLLLKEMGAIQKSDDSRQWTISEQTACRPPQERLFASGTWQQGIYPHSVSEKSDLEQWEKFQVLVHNWIDWRDPQGRRAFTIPLDFCSKSEEVTSLDQISASAWLDQQQLTSKPLRWLIDYCCRDDYGLTSEQTSALGDVVLFCLSPGKFWTA